MNEVDASSFHERETLSRQAQTGRLVYGGMFMAAGVLLLVFHRDIFSVFGLWPLLLVAIGLARVLGDCCAHSRRGGFWLLVFGAWFALNEFTSLGYHDTWPLLVVAIGGLVTWNAIAPCEPCALCREGGHGR